MQKRIIPLALTLVLAGTTAMAQSGGQPSIAQSLDMYVFPEKGQSATKQSEDEATCYQWGVSNSGVDPFAVQKQQAANAQQAQANQAAAAQAGQGAAARGAVGGAAAGALIGEIGSGNAGRGAAYGAAAGLLIGHHRKREQQEMAQQQAAAQAQQAQAISQSDMTNFKNAFSACLEAKDYIVKF